MKILVFSMQSDVEQYLVTILDNVLSGWQCWHIDDLINYGAKYILNDDESIFVQKCSYNVLQSWIWELGSSKHCSSGHFFFHPFFVRNMKGNQTIYYFLNLFFVCLGLVHVWKTLWPEIRRWEEDAQPGQSRTSASLPNAPLQQPNVPLLQEKLFGMEDRVAYVTNGLLQHNGHIVAIVGMGGIGKTTLANAACHDPKIQSEFPIMVWVLVSPKPNVKGIQSSIWQQLNGTADSPHFATEEEGFQKIQLCLCRLSQSVLLIIDDVWNVGHLRYLHFKGENLKLLITSRCINVAKSLHAVCYHVPELGFEASMHLFCWHAFWETSATTSDSAEFVEPMVASCKGLPLTLEVLGSTAANYRMKDEWAHALEELTTSKSGKKYLEPLSRALRLSYEQLDNQLQKCCLTFAAFPEDYRLLVSDLVELWCAKMGVSGRSARVMVKQLFDASLIKLDSVGIPGYQVSSSEVQMCFIGFGNADCLLIDGCKYRCCYVHDAVWDMAMELVQEEKPAQGSKLLSPRLDDFQEEHSSVQEMSICSSRTKLATHWPDGLGTPKLEVFYSRNSGLASIPKCVMASTVLKILDISFCDVSIIPEEIGMLASLRILRLDGCTNVERLPLGISGLKQLSVLSARLCYSLKEIPDQLGRCTDLHSLHVPHCALKFLPSSFGKIRSLTKLDFSFCEVLAGLPTIIGSLHKLQYLCLAGCQNLKDLPDTIGGLTELRSLVLSGCITLVTLQDTMSSMNMLTILDLQGCENILELPNCIWELQSLKVLRLLGCLRLRNFMGPKESMQNMDVLGLPLVPDEKYERSPLLPKRIKLHGRWWHLHCHEESLQKWVDGNKKILVHLPSDHYDYIVAKVCCINIMLMPISLTECCNPNVHKSGACRVQYFSPFDLWGMTLAPSFLGGQYALQPTLMPNSF